MHRRSEQYQDVISKLFPNPYFQDSVSVKTITFQVTDACNLKCTYCYQINKSTHVMPFEVAKRFIDMILDCDENTEQYIDSKHASGCIIEFIGGEPFLQIDLVSEISDYFEQQLILRNHPWATRHMFSICSNGVLYFDPKVQKYIKNHMGRLALSISIDGNKELHDSCRVFPDGSGSYDIAMKAVNHFINVLGGKMGSKMTLCPENISYTFDAVVSLLQNGYKDINLNCVYEEGWTNEHAKILYSELKKLADYILENDYDDCFISIFEENWFHPKSLDDTQNWCGGNGDMISLDWKGDIYPCIRFMESSLGNNLKPLVVGNVYDGIMVLKDHKQCAECLKNINRINQSSDECLNCTVAEGCGYCQAYNYQHSGGKIDKRATFHCIMHKARALANCYYWNKLYIKHNENKIHKLWLKEEDALKIIDKDEYDMLIQLRYR